MHWVIGQGVLVMSVTLTGPECCYWVWNELYFTQLGKLAGTSLLYEGSPGLVGRHSMYDISL